MALTTNHTNNELVKFRRDVTLGFYREHRFARYTGASANSIIRMVRDLSADGKEIRVPLVDQLRGSGVGSGTLNGREEAIDNYGQPMWADWLRHATKWTKATEKDSVMNIRNVANPVLSTFAKRIIKEEMVYALASIPTGSTPTGFRGEFGARINGIKWSDATAGQKNAWDVANSDRVVYGKLLSNRSAGAVATSLGNIDTTDDRLTKDVVSLAKRVAMATTQNKITPYMVEDDGQEQYVMFVGSRAMRDLKASMITELREAWSGKGYEQNPLFRPGDVIWDNVIVTEIPEIDDLLTLSGVGASSSSVVPCFLCGSNALAYVVGQMPQPTRLDESDYGFNTGIGIETQYGIGKIAKIPAGGSALKDWGMVTQFVSSVADA